jgi:type I restriction enzyme S subunit
LPATWRAVAFGDLLADGTRNGLYKPKTFHGRGVKIVNMGELFGYPRLVADVPMKRLAVDPDELSKFGLRAGDLLFARRSLVAEGAGKCCLVLEVSEPTVFESSIIRATPNPSLADSRYLFYVFESTIGRYLLGTILRQTAVAGITGTDLVKLEVPLPPLAEQRRIAAILGALDDKIELNRKMNRTLEEMAQAIFKSWFIDFDGYDDLVDSEIGPVPRGWEATTLGKVIEVYDRLRVPLSGRERAQRQGCYPYYGAASVMDYINVYLFDGIYVLVGEDGSVVDDKGHPITQYVWGKFWVNNHAHVLLPKAPVGIEHLLLALKNTNIRPFMTGAVQAKVSQGNLARVPFLLPPRSMCELFTRLVEPMYDRLRANSEESRTLTTLRDTLLPKLISGELRVPEAEELVGAAPAS